MNTPQKSAARILPEEYLALEEKARFKHEYLDGVIYSWQGNVPEAIAGGSRMHNRIVQNIVAALRPHLRGSGCRTYATDVLLHVRARDAYFYPDVAVTCSETEESPLPENAALFREPRVIFEVLSDSTEAFDRGAKFDAYRSIPTLEEYVLVSARAARVELYRRAADGTWSLEPSVTDAVRLESIQATLPFLDIYDDVSLGGSRDQYQS